jgi:hypothetical protein
VYHNTALLRARLDLGALELADKSQLPDFVEGLLAILLGIREHRCFKGRRGGSVKRLEGLTVGGRRLRRAGAEPVPGMAVASPGIEAAGFPGTGELWILRLPPAVL